MWRGRVGITLLALLGLQSSVLAAESAARFEQQARSALRLRADALHGMALYRKSCASCHGAEAHGDVIRLIPALAGQRRAYLVKHLAELNDAERAAMHMHPALDVSELREPQAWIDVAEYLRISEPLAVPVSRNDQLAARGERNYSRRCAQCHGKDATGNDARFVPGLRYQQHPYLLKQLQMLSAQHRLSVGPEVLRVMDSLSAEAVAGIADHVSRIKDRPAR